MSGINNYFSNNNIFNGTEIPTQGKFDVGDIIVNIGENAEEEPMWMCIEAGEPGVWKVVGKVEEIDLSGYQEKTDENLVTESKDLVGAINELFQSANNGKELIADVIGEPLDSSDTFSAMSDDINSLLSTFKTNMMNNGITVESSDKFKTLIDKIATMVEEGSGKGIQYTTGDIAGFNMEYNQTKNTTINIDFKPSFIFIEFEDRFKNTNGASFTLSPMVMSNTRSLVVSLATNSTVAYYMSFNINNITEESFDFIASTMYSIPSYTMIIPNAKWYAIGVGEDDTTLRDSLASILTDEGVEVTDEDDMASLITKVDEEFTAKDENDNKLKQNLIDVLSNKGVDVATNTSFEEVIGFVTDIKTYEFTDETNFTIAMIDKELLGSSNRGTHTVYTHTGLTYPTCKLYFKHIGSETSTLTTTIIHKRNNEILEETNYTVNEYTTYIKHPLTDLQENDVIDVNISGGSAYSSNQGATIISLLCGITLI